MKDERHMKQQNLTSRTRNNNQKTKRSRTSVLVRPQYIRGAQKYAPAVACMRSVVRYSCTRTPTRMPQNKDPQ